MNDIDLLRAYGPDVPPVTPEALGAARSRLRDEIAAPARRTRWTLSRWPQRAAAVLSLIAVGAVAFLVFAGSPSLTAPFRPATGTGGPADPRPIKLVASTRPEFGWSLPGLGEPTFTSGVNGPVAVYPAEDHSDVYLSAAPSDPPGVRGARRTEVDGRPGWIAEFRQGDGGGAVELAWEHEPDRWLRVTGHGRYATERATRELAARVRADPQPIELRYTVGLVPDGWELRGFKSGGSIVTYADPRRPETDLSVAPIDRLTKDPAREITDFEALSTVDIRGRRTPLIRARDFWRAEITLADGSLVQLSTPRSFTPDQVLAMARSIRRNIS